MTQPPRRPTLREVAREAGVSVTQTSRALGDHDDVAPTTKVAVRDAAQRLGYVPNVAARRLVTGSTRTDALGLIVPQADLEFSDATFAALLSGIVDVATAGGRELRLTASVADPDDVEPYRRAARSRQVDGFFLVRTRVDDARCRVLGELSYPYVTLGRPSDGSDAPSVDDAEQVMDPIVEHLVGLGHRHIGCILEPQRYALAVRRARSLMDALAAHDLTPAADHVVDAGYHWGSGYDAARQLLSLPTTPTALVALNDGLALGALAAVRDAGLRTPQDVSVTGLDDIPAAAFTRPGLTTLRRDAREVGRLLCRQLVDLLEGTSTTDTAIRMEPLLVERGSTGPPPTS